MKVSLVEPDAPFLVMELTRDEARDLAALLGALSRVEWISLLRGSSSHSLFYKNDVAAGAAGDRFIKMYSLLGGALDCR